MLFDGFVLLRPRGRRWPAGSIRAKIYGKGRVGQTGYRVVEDAVAPGGPEGIDLAVEYLPLLAGGHPSIADLFHCLPLLPADDNLDPRGLSVN